jgi:paraquat-inducible protein A
VGTGRSAGKATAMDREEPRKLLIRVWPRLRNLWRAEHSLSCRARGLDRLVDPALVASVVLFWIGITLPVMTVTELWVFENEFSILEGIHQLWVEDEAPLSVLVAAFSIAFPVLKIGLACLMWLRADAGRPYFRYFQRLLAVSGRWSMADVFVIATAIMIAKIAGFADATSEAGLYYFMASLALVAFATFRIEKAGESL